MLKVFGIKRILRKSQKNSAHSVSKKIQTFERPSDNVIPTEDFSKVFSETFKRSRSRGTMKSYSVSKKQNRLGKSLRKC